VKVKVSFAGICGSELSEYLNGPHIAAEKLPLIAGHEFTGKVAEIGQEVIGLKVGERVAGAGNWICGECFYCKKGMYNLCLNSSFIGMNVDGCMAEYLVVPHYLLYKLPNSVTDEAGALVEPMAVAIHAIRQAKVCAGDSVAIVGDGTIGLCSLLAAKAAGATAVYVVSKHDGRGALASQMGANAVIHFRDGDTVQIVRNMTGGLGADVVLACAGNPDALNLSIELARRGGIITLVGIIDRPMPFQFANIVFDEKCIVGSSIYIHEGKTAIALMADKRIDASRLITSIVPLKDAVKLGFDKLLESREDNVKILVQMPK
jgi:(R,R)-butanediol dehydrogenase/meso-butanediol dehydrogenase/diacetyl reductase